MDPHMFDDLGKMFLIFVVLCFLVGVFLGWAIFS